MAPVITGVVAGPTSISITWEEDSSIANHQDFRGYNIYVCTDTSLLLVENGEYLSPYNSTAITTNSYTVLYLSKGSIYFIQVRTVNTSGKVGSYNAVMPFVSISPRPEFIIGQLNLELSPVDSNETGVALRFSTGEILNEVNNQFPNADIFVERFAGDSVQLVSAGRRPNGRSTLIVNFKGTYTYDDWDFSDIYFGTSDYAAINLTDLLLCKTEVKIHVAAIDKNNQTVTITYAYQDNPDFPYFSPGN